ncbi:nickel-binding protein [Streptomyces sp. NPDC051684]|uniref:nickel-binding protein n=1 Tax=Streptomyces sp. NPDC051684 TaxID=3365670 RepID=UPI00379DA42E
MEVAEGGATTCPSSWTSTTSGTVYCLSDAPSAEAVQRIHERAGHRADEIHPVPLTA